MEVTPEFKAYYKKELEVFRVKKEELEAHLLPLADALKESMDDPEKFKAIWEREKQYVDLLQAPPIDFYTNLWSEAKRLGDFVALKAVKKMIKDYVSSVEQSEDKALKELSALISKVVQEEE